MIGLLQKPGVNLPISLQGCSKRISGNSLSPLGAQNKDIGAVSRAFLYSTWLDFISMHAGNLSTNL